jgi:hypothetical protein
MIYNKTSGIRLLTADTALIGQIVELKKGTNVVRLRIEQLHLNPDVYILGLKLSTKAGRQTPLDYLESTFEMEVVHDKKVAHNKSETFGIQEYSPVTCKFKILETT